MTVSTMTAVFWSRLRPSPPYRPKRVMSPASTPRNDAIVITATSRWATWESSCDSTPSSSSWSSRRMMPVVTQTTAFCGLRPVAKAFGRSTSAIATRGFGMSASAQSRSIVPCSSGASSGVTIRPCIAYNAIRSENQYCTNSAPPAMTTASTALFVSAISSATKPTYSRPSRKLVISIRLDSPRSGANRVFIPRPSSPDSEGSSGSNPVVLAALQVQVGEQRAELGAEEVAGGDLADGHPQRRHLTGQELHVRTGPGVDVAVALVLHPVAGLLPVLGEQNQRSGVRRLQAERQRQEDERVLVEPQVRRGED